MGPFVRSAYNYDMLEASTESGLLCEDPSLAVQASRDEVDINTIVRRFGLTGQLPDEVALPQYGDFMGISDYQTALNAVLAADEQFMALPAELRNRFGNSAHAFVEFCSDPGKNGAEMLKLGLLKEPPVAAPVVIAEVAKPVV